MNQPQLEGASVWVGPTEEATELRFVTLPKGAIIAGIKPKEKRTILGNYYEEVIVKYRLSEDGPPGFKYRSGPTGYCYYDYEEKDGGVTLYFRPYEE